MFIWKDFWDFLRNLFELNQDWFGFLWIKLKISRILLDYVEISAILLKFVDVIGFLLNAAEGERDSLGFFRDI